MILIPGPKSWSKIGRVSLVKISVVFFATAANLLGIANGITNLADVPCGIKEPEGVAVEVKQSEFQGSCLSRIINGVDAKPGEFPWMVSLRYKWGEVFCGGFIIHRRYILTAAHCFVNDVAGNVKQEYMEAVLGTHDLRENGMTFDFESIITHPLYQRQDSTNDIALIRLDKDIEWSPLVRPACLPSKSFQPEGLTSVVTGWGLEHEASPNTQVDVLKKVRIPIITNAKCKDWFKRASIKWSPKLMHLCAGCSNGGFDTCLGDSGGPLMVSDPSINGGDKIVVGIVAAGKGCGRPQLPGVYTRVSHYLDWIKGNIRRDERKRKIHAVYKD